MKNSEELAEEYYDQMANHYGSVKDLAKLLRDFATYHVTEALKEASEKAEKLMSHSWEKEYQQSIINAYPLTNIK